jgi:hypothetical protein
MSVQLSITPCINILVILFDFISFSKWSGGLLNFIQIKRENKTVEEGHLQQTPGDYVPIVEDHPCRLAIGGAKAFLS